MNERIQELIRDVGFTNNDLGDGRYQMLIEFAELIVRECLMKVTGAKIRKESYDELIARINEDFGVEL
jgi:hypothetical protein